MGTARRSGEGTQLALPLEEPGAPALEPLGEWGEAIADYRSTGMTLGEHPLALMRAELPRELLRSADLERVEDGATVEVAGMVVARQRPETAKGIVFMLLEDERGTVNLIVPPRSTTATAPRSAPRLSSAPRVGSSAAKARSTSSSRRWRSSSAPRWTRSRPPVTASAAAAHGLLRKKIFQFREPGRLSAIGGSPCAASPSKTPHR